MSGTRRTLLACGIALACALAVFALPGLAWSSVRSVAGFGVAQDSIAPAPATQDTARVLAPAPARHASVSAARCRYASRR